MNEKPTNKDFAKENVAFKNACDKVGFPATARQASKYRNKKGIVYSSTH